jgi:hypothetical protein
MIQMARGAQLDGSQVFFWIPRLDKEQPRC